ncbi:pilus assembly FimT family protein [Neisseria montereyensis]|uniref:Type II secretion system protein H n=1 Tax=Neisseria montereyensis TaxID=2973938 RepID=A0ABT2FD16_9NEIS|nr:GspH/FimT family pseudopilin [Neisseria montereyensis]MCS4533445.1 GspH/FimT family pseudopilin [Neisseria montereyensis]
MRLKNQGFTLTELLIVIAIVAIMATIALPNMSDWIASRRTASRAEHIVNLLRFARSEAVRLNVPVYVCPVAIRKDGNPDRYCDADQAGEGLAAFADNNKDGSYSREDDTNLRTVILNMKDQERVSYQFETYDFNYDKTGNNKVWGFLPNGMFGHAESAGDKLSMASGFVKISLTDSAAQNERTKKSRSRIVWLDSSGRVNECSGNSTANDTDNNNNVAAMLCEYKTAE